MVIDTSALIAVVLAESAASALERAVARANTRLISAATLVEADVVILRRFSDAGIPMLDRVLSRFAPTVVPVTHAHAVLAREAFRQYGKTRHPAALNFGDCFSYALAMDRGEPLLFIGNDFSRTNVAIAEY